MKISEPTKEELNTLLAGTASHRGSGIMTEIYTAVRSAKHGKPLVLDLADDVENEKLSVKTIPGIVYKLRSEGYDVVTKNKTTLIYSGKTIPESERPKPGSRKSAPVENENKNE